MKGSRQYAYLKNNMPAAAIITKPAFPKVVWTRQNIHAILQTSTGHELKTTTKLLVFLYKAKLKVMFSLPVMSSVQKHMTLKKSLRSVSRGISLNKETFHPCPRVWLTQKCNHLFISVECVHERVCVSPCTNSCGLCVTQIDISLRHGEAWKESEYRYISLPRSATRKKQKSQKTNSHTFCSSVEHLKGDKDTESATKMSWVSVRATVDYDSDWQPGAAGVGVERAEVKLTEVCKDIQPHGERL